MSFAVALQSLLFYIASCAPCHQAAHHHRLRKEAKNRRAEASQRVITEGYYQQPEPFSTNPFWAEEISMGPNLDRKKRWSLGQRPTTGAGNSSFVGYPTSANTTPNVTTGAVKTATGKTGTPTTPTVTGGASTTTPTATTGTTTPTATTGITTPSVTTGTTTTPAGATGTTKTPTTITLTDPSSIPVSLAKENEKPVDKIDENPNVRVGGRCGGASGAASTQHESEGYSMTPDMTTSLPHDWNHKRYQREDEELWGSSELVSRTGHKLMNAIKHAGSSAGRFIESSLGKDVRLSTADEGEEKRWFLPVTPPVNDYHPPIIRRPQVKGFQWMVQPPPPATVMEGKVPVSRGNSIYSNASRRNIMDGLVTIDDSLSVPRPTLNRTNSSDSWMTIMYDGSSAGGSTRSAASAAGKGKKVVTPEQAEKTEKTEETEKPVEGPRLGDL
ncbi:hypothetical protein F5Y14DRAFT_33815 [Nemania sp. NC0429]|nr:hypothetical protein F5Y14DRAFT_33815 [Nemania sp. NC0429]